MTSGIEFNKSYDTTYVLLPLKKVNGMGLKVTSSNKELDNKMNNMNNFDDLRSADADKNGIISLDELKNCKNKTDFMELIEKAMEKFNSNPKMDYTNNLFEEWV